MESALCCYCSYHGCCDGSSNVAFFGEVVFVFGLSEVAVLWFEQLKADVVIYRLAVL